MSQNFRRILLNLFAKNLPRTSEICLWDLWFLECNLSTSSSNIHTLSAFWETLSYNNLYTLEKELLHDSVTEVETSVIMS